MQSFKKNKIAVQAQIIIKYPSHLLTLQTPEAQGVNRKTTIQNWSLIFPVPKHAFSHVSLYHPCLCCLLFKEDIFQINIWHKSLNLSAKID